MDYLDPKKQARHRVILFVGYILIASGVTVAALILLQLAYGTGIGKNGAVIQNGVVFFSSQPNPAKIKISGLSISASTNTSLYIPSGIYNVSLSRSGYYNWQRTIQVDGGSVEHFDYPFLFPKVLTTNPVQTYTGQPAIFSQSPDRRWLLVGKPGSLTDFDMYDLSNPTKAFVSTISLPANLLTKALTDESMQVVGWADDNQHVLLQHNFDGKSEYVLLDRTDPTQSVNLDNLATSPSEVELNNKKFNQYYIYNSTTGILQSALLGSTTATTVLQHVLAYQSYGNNTVLYITNEGAASGKVLVRMLVGNTSTTIRSLEISPSYVLNLTEYNGVMYIAVGTSSGDKVYIYQDPLGQLANSPGQAVVPSQVLFVNQPNYLSFSDNAQFIVDENGSHFGVYDIENQKGYSYVTPSEPDSPMTNATWMDGDRLDYVSGGKLYIFDYDNTNQHLLVKASSNFEPAFSPDYKYVYVIAESSDGQFDLNQTSLLTTADQ